ncbi:unnamed protein product, partial [Staurois parvus]
MLVTFSLADSVRFQPTVAAAPTYTHSHFYCRNMCVWIVHLHSG